MDNSTVSILLAQCLKITYDVSFEFFIYSYQVQVPMHVVQIGQIHHATSCAEQF